jgi:hypothetical protein
MIYKNLNLEYSIVTFPRVGSYYLQDRMLQHTGVYVKKYHNVKSNKMITIARDPADALASKLAMSVFYDKSNEIIEDIRSNKITKDVEEYFDVVKKINPSKDFYAIIDYKDLIESPFEITVTLADTMGVAITNKDYKENSVTDKPEISHIVSSKRIDEYKEIKDYVEKLDLSLLYNFYNKAIAHSIKIM